jgi:APA family basic amino acid/polyamine antiporter
MIIVADMVGSGIFTTSGFIMQDLKSPPAMLLCWLIGGLLALTGALCYGELGAMFPASGGDYVFLRESFGKRIAFLSGWISLLVGFSAPIAAIAIAFGNYFTGSLPAGLSPLGTPTVLAVIIIIIFTCVHSQDLIFGVRTHVFFTIGKIIIIMLLITVGLTYGNGTFEHFKSSLKMSDIFSGGFATSLIFVSFSYSGWNASVYLGSEIKNAGRNIPLSIISATVFVIVAYMLLNIVYIYAVNPSDMYGVEDIGSLAASKLFGSKIGSLFGLAIAFCLLSSLSSMIMLGPRVYHAMSKDKLFFALFQNIDKKHHVPTYSIILQAGIAILLVCTSTFYAILMYVGFILSIFASLTVIGMMLLRKKSPSLLRPYKTWGYPLTPILFVGINIWIVIFSIRNNLTAFIWGLVTIVVGLVAYECFERNTRKSNRL